MPITNRLLYGLTVTSVTLYRYDELPKVTIGVLASPYAAIARTGSRGFFSFGNRGIGVVSKTSVPTGVLQGFSATVSKMTNADFADAIKTAARCKTSPTPEHLPQITNPFSYWISKGFKFLRLTPLLLCCIIIGLHMSNNSVTMT